MSAPFLASALMVALVGAGAASVPAPSSPFPPPAEPTILGELERAEMELDAGQAREALARAEILLREPLAADLRQRALSIAAGAATLLDDPVRARFYRLARWADPGIPPELIRDQAEERYREFVANAEALVRTPMPRERERSLRLLLCEAYLALGLPREAAASARGLGPEWSGELLLEASERLLDSGDPAGAWDAAATALPPAFAEEEDERDERGFREARAHRMARAALALGDPEEAVLAAAELLELAEQDSERAAAHAVLGEARRRLDSGRPEDCAALDRLAGLGW